VPHRPRAVGGGRDGPRHDPDPARALVWQVVELMKHSLRDVCEAPDGSLEFTRSALCGGMSMASASRCEGRGACMPAPPL
jgi:hypothetical protein